MEVLMECAALVSTCVTSLGSLLQNDANSGLWVLVYTVWAARCARHISWDPYGYQQLWYFCLVLCAMIKGLDLSTFPGSRASNDMQAHWIHIVDFIDWSTVPIANSRGRKGWHCFSSHCPERPNRNVGFVKYNSYTSEIFMTENCLAWRMKLSTRQLSRRSDSAMSTCSSDAVQEVFAIPASNVLALVLALHSWIVAKGSTDNIVEAPRMIRLPAPNVSFHCSYRPNLFSLWKTLYWRRRLKILREESRLSSELDCPIQLILLHQSLKRFPTLIVCWSYATLWDAWASWFSLQRRKMK